MNRLALWVIAMLIAPPVQAQSLQIGAEETAAGGTASKGDRLSPRTASARLLAPTPIRPAPARTLAAEYEDGNFRSRLNEGQAARRMRFDIEVRAGITTGLEPTRLIGPPKHLEGEIVAGAADRVPASFVVTHRAIDAPAAGVDDMITASTGNAASSRSGARRGNEEASRPAAGPEKAADEKANSLPKRKARKGVAGRKRTAPVQAEVVEPAASEQVDAAAPVRPPTAGITVQGTASARSLEQAAQRRGFGIDGATALPHSNPNGVTDDDGGASGTLKLW
jgi:hypothetical protein